MNVKKEDISELLIQLRKEHGLTQATLAERLGISFQAVSKWERGENLPDAYTLLELADIYKVTVDELLRGQIKDKDLAGKVRKRKFILFVVAVIMLVLSPTSIFVLGVMNYEQYVPIILIIAAIAVPLILYATVTTNELIGGTMKTYQNKKRSEIVYAFAAGIFLLLGFVWGAWHPGWIVFVFAYALTLVVAKA